jgi:ribosome maturation factor RimP
MSTVSPIVQDQIGQIEGVVESLLKAEGLELIDLEFRKEGRGWVLRIFMDKPGGVTLDDCAGISRQLGDQLEVDDVIPHAYTLEVSSPGLDRPLFRDKDFQRYRGEQVSIRVGEKIEGRRHFRGELVDYGDEDGRKVIAVRVADQVFRIPRDAVVKANLEYEL